MGRNAADIRRIEAIELRIGKLDFRAVFGAELEVARAYGGLGNAQAIASAVLAEERVDDPGISTRARKCNARARIPGDGDIDQGRTFEIDGTSIALAGLLDNQAVRDRASSNRAGHNEG